MLHHYVLIMNYGIAAAVQENMLLKMESAKVS